VCVHARKAANLLANNPPGSVNAYWSIRPRIDRNEPPTVTGSFSIYSRSLITGFTVLYKLTEKGNETIMLFVLLSLVKFLLSWSTI